MNLTDSQVTRPTRYWEYPSPSFHVRDREIMLSPIDNTTVGSTVHSDFWNENITDTGTISDPGVWQSFRVAYILSSEADATNLELAPEAAPLSELLSGYERYTRPNWDCYGAEPITEETLASARQFLTLLPGTLGEPDIAPGADGTIGLEWSFRDRPLRKLFIDVGPGKVWSGYWRRASGERRTLPRREIIEEQTRAVLLDLFQELNN